MVGDDFTREYLTNRQDVRNVLNQYNIRGIEKHPSDHSSVCAWVSELRTSQGFDPIIYFKQQGDEDGTLGKEHFLLCIQTEFQLEMLKEFGHRVICIDATHATNMYDFLLITVLVVDEFGEGVPVAWAISNKEDTGTLSLFLEQLRVRSGDLKPEYFMTDDAQQYWKSWVATYGMNDTLKLLCTWHVDRAWRKALVSLLSIKRAELLYTINYGCFYQKSTRQSFAFLCSSFCRIL